MATSYNVSNSNLVTASRLTAAAIKKTVSLARTAYQWEIKLNVQGRTFGVYFTDGYRYQEYRIREYLDAPTPWKQSFHETRKRTAGEATNFILNLF